MGLPRPRIVAEDLVPRLNRSRSEIEDLRGSLSDAIKRRDRLVVRACDEGTSQGAVAAAAGITRGRVIAILAGSHDDEEETAGV